MTRKDVALSALFALCLTSASTASVSVVNFRRCSKHNALLYTCSARGAEARVLSAVAVEEVESTLPQLSALTVDGSLGGTVGFLAHKRSVARGGWPIAGAAT